MSSLKQLFKTAVHKKQDRALLVNEVGVVYVVVHVLRRLKEELAWATDTSKQLMVIKPGMHWPRRTIQARFLKIVSVWISVCLNPQGY